jgi:guanylate kinase
MAKGRLFIISGPSGAGKGTICTRLLEETEKLFFSVSMTTRKPREGEIEGRDYYFVSEEKVLEMKAGDGFLESAYVYQDHYGTPRQMVMEKLDSGNDVVLDIDIQGAMSIKKVYPDGVFIFILPPSMAELRERITGRGTEENESIEVRMAGAKKEIAYIHKYDYCVVNGELEEAVCRVKAIITAEHSRVSEDIYELIEKYKEEI